MEKPADNQHPIHEIIRNRWSPRAFSERPIANEPLLSLLEAARWSPSCFNDQPWHFILAQKEAPETFDKMLFCLSEQNQTWAKHAAVLMLAVARDRFAHNGKKNRHARYDTGQAVAALTLQATALGIRAHQMAGFSPEKSRETFGIPADHEAITAIALGYPGNIDMLPKGLQDQERKERFRRPLGEFVFSTQWNREAIPLK